MPVVKRLNTVGMMESELLGREDVRQNYQQQVGVHLVDYNGLIIKLN